MRTVAWGLSLAFVVACQTASAPMPMHKESSAPAPGKRGAESADEGFAGKAGVDRRPAYRLLDKYAELLRLVGSNADPSLLDPELDPLLDTASTLRRDGVVDETFTARHAELIEVTRTFLSPLAGATAEARIREWAAAVPNAPALDAGPLSMATLAPVIVEEVVNLHLLVSGDNDRAATRAALGFTPR